MDFRPLSSQGGAGGPVGRSFRSSFASHETNRRCADACWAKASALRSAWPARSAASSGVHPMARRTARTCPARRSHRSCPLRKATKPAECTAARVIDPAPRADYHGHGNRLGDRQGPVALLTHSYRHLAFLQKSDTGSRAHRSDRRGAVPKLEVSPNLGCCHGRVSRTSRAIRASGCGWVGVVEDELGVDSQRGAGICEMRSFDPAFSNLTWMIARWRQDDDDTR